MTSHSGWAYIIIFDHGWKKIVKHKNISNNKLYEKDRKNEF